MVWRNSQFHDVEEMIQLGLIREIIRNCSWKKNSKKGSWISSKKLSLIRVEIQVSDGNN